MEKKSGGLREHRSGRPVISSERGTTVCVSAPRALTTVPSRHVVGPSPCLPIEFHSQDINPRGFKAPPGTPRLLGTGCTRVPDATSSQIRT